MHRALMTALLSVFLLGAVAPPGAAAASCDTYAGALAAMVDADQALRKRIDFLNQDTPEQLKNLQHLALVDRTNTERLKSWVARCGWPDKTRDGDQAAGHAWLLTQHADHDRPFQKRMLALIEEAAMRAGESAGKNFAYLYDRIAVAEQRPQHYGTQFLNVGSRPCDLDFAPMEAIGLMPLAAYQRLMREMQHCPTDVATGRPNEDYHYAPPVKP
ncbi:DUF6624 domain-containing protein [Massilia sp. DD77]|uniref:DUF6624 domain-containing protein n=1 Tax=Massilia sp. DD77 TaxID=3109349 RepID=UPI002FFDD30B